MAKTGFLFTGDIKLFKKFLNPTIWRGNLKSEIHKATILNSLFLIKQIKNRIRQGKYEKNAPLTLALKRSDLPLINNRNLWNGIDHMLKSSFESEVGIVSNKLSTGSQFGRSKNQINLKTLVTLMEEGYTIKVTDKMKRAIAIALEKDRNKEGKVKEHSSIASQRVKEFSNEKTYVVPSRPLFSSVFTDPDNMQTVKDNWISALERAYKMQGAKGGEHLYKRL